MEQDENRWFRSSWVSPAGVCKCPRGIARVAVLVVCICLTRNPKVGYYGLTKEFGKLHVLILQTQPVAILYASQTF